ncbi:MAG: hypothetical protein ACI9MC_001545, partial [Kiritimatiellia bacterium]
PCMSLLELLQKGDVDAFNSTRGARSRPDLFAADLAGLRLIGIDLSSANLEKADLTETNLSDANLMRADLSGVDGSGMDLSGIIGIKIRLRGAWVDGCKLLDADLSRADCTDAVFQGSTGEGVRFVGAKLRSADCKNVVWPMAEMTEAKVHAADFTGADLSRGDFTEMSAAEAVFVNANMEASIGTNANMSSANLTGAQLRGARFQGANLSSSNLTNACLVMADFTRANLSDAVFTGADLSGVCLADANLEGATLTGAKLDGADLTGHDPRLLGLDDATIETLSAWGAAHDADAPLIISEPAAARSGGFVALLWLNPDSETLNSLRWGLMGQSSVTTGILHISTDGVQARAVVPTQDGFELVILQDRPGGAVLVCVPLSTAGVTGVPSILPLGYQPAVAPVMEFRDGVMLVFGIARRGPTLIVQQRTDEGLVPTHSERVATARGFYGRHHAVLATRGGVVMNVGRDGAGKPVRTPDGFPGKKVAVVPFQDKLLAVWTREKVGDDQPGAILYSWLGGRAAPDVHTLRTCDRVMSLDATSGPDGVHIAWVEAGSLFSAITFTTVLPGGKLSLVEAAGDSAHEARFASGGAGVAPALVIATLDEQVIAVDGTRKIGVIGG